MRRGELVFIAGAPGSGKSTVVARLVARPVNVGKNKVFFDIDTLVESASALAGQDIRSAPETWPPYNALWLNVLCAVLANSLTPVLFTPNDPSDFEGQPLPKGCTEIRWLLLDCDDEVRRERLRERGWHEARVRYALEDAAAMRRLISQHLDTTALSPDDVADSLLSWLELDE